MFIERVLYWKLLVTKEQLHLRSTVEHLREVKRKLSARFSLKNLDVDFDIHGDGVKAHYQIYFMIRDSITLEGLRDLCDEISEYLGGDLYGEVHIDYSGTTTSVDMLCELPEQEI